MADCLRVLRSFLSRDMPLIVVAVTLALAGASCATGGRPARSLDGVVTSDGTGLAGYQVSLYASYAGTHARYERIGSAKTDGSGHFRIMYSPVTDKEDLTNRRHPVLFLIAENGPAMLASAIGTGSDAPDKVVVNERTTIATGNAFAQFVQGKEITGNAYGMANAAHMARNLADPQTGAVGMVLKSSPNGIETSTYLTFNSLTNVVASCIAEARNCAKLFQATTPPGRSPPESVLQAIANLVKNPAYPGYPADADDPIFLLSRVKPTYQPTLSVRPTSWLLFLKITGKADSAQDADNLMNGPGNFAIDEQGFVWVNDNAVPQPTDHFACAGRRLIKFYPWGKNFDGSPYFGGGLSGAGYGITLDPSGKVWVGNFGFQDPPCALLPRAAPHNSISAFQPDGTPISPAGGYTKGEISWPQGTVSDRQGNIWVANCGTDSVTKIPGGDPNQAFNIPLASAPEPGDPQLKPFGAVVDLDGNVWFNNNRANTISIVSPKGHVIDTLPGTYQGKTVLSHPVGSAADSKETSGWPIQTGSIRPARRGPCWAPQPILRSRCSE
jgi:hypothetical protein